MSASPEMMDTALYAELDSNPQFKGKKRCFDACMRSSKAMCMARSGTWNRLWWTGGWGVLVLAAWIVTLIVIPTKDKCMIPTMDIRSCCNETALGKDIIVVGSILTQPCREKQCEAFISNSGDDAWNKGNAGPGGAFVLQMSIRDAGRVDGAGGGRKHRSLQSSSHDNRRDRGDQLVDNIACVQVCRACQEAPPTDRICGWRKTRCEGGRTGSLWVDTNDCVGLGGRSGGFDKPRHHDRGDDWEGGEGGDEGEEGGGGDDEGGDWATDNSMCCDNWSDPDDCDGGHRNRTDHDGGGGDDDDGGRRGGRGSHKRAEGKALCTSKCGEWFDWDRNIWVLTQGSCARARRCRDSNDADCKLGKQRQEHGRNLLSDDGGDDDDAGDDDDSNHGKKNKEGGGKERSGNKKSDDDAFDYDDILPPNVHKENVHWIDLPPNRDYSYLRGSMHLRTITAAVVITTRDGQRFYAPIGQGINGASLP